MRLFQPRPSTTKPSTALAGHDDLVSRWRDRIDATIPVTSNDHSDACDDVVTALQVGVDHLHNALRRFGTTFGSLGWNLTDTARWIDELAEIAGTDAAALRTFAAGLAVAEGWTVGSQYGIRQREAYDPLTGVATLGVMRLRIGQVLDHCRALAVRAEQVYCLVVLDVDVSGLWGLERDATLVMVADRIQRRFNAGETIAYSDGRFLILASHHESTRTAVLDLIADIRSVPFVTNQQVLGWIEDLPALTTSASIDPTEIDAYLLELIA